MFRIILSANRQLSALRRYSSSLEIPQKPKSFKKHEFEMPEHAGKMFLEEVNPHTLDSRVSYDQASKTFYLDGVGTERHIDRVVEQYFEMFNADKAIVAMKKSGNWPRPNYMKFGRKVPMTDIEIKTTWDKMKEYADNSDLWMRYNITRHLNNMSISVQDVNQMHKYIRFHDEIIVAKEMQPYRTDWCVADFDTRLVGKIGFVGKFADGTYGIIDWKNTKDLHDKVNTLKFGKRAKFPLEHIDDCEGSKHFLEMNFYRHILSKYYNMTVSYMAIASFHPSTGDNYFMAEAPSWNEEISTILRNVPDDDKDKES